jgi:hypothetical protein
VITVFLNNNENNVFSDDENWILRPLMESKKTLKLLNEREVEWRVKVQDI